MSEIITAPTTAAVPVLANRPDALSRAGATAARLWDRGRHELGEGIDAAGDMAVAIHRRLMLAILALAAVLVAGAAFRAIGWPEGNYLLIALVGLAALYLVLSPTHVIGTLLVSGGVAAFRGMGAGGATLAGYARLLGQVLLAVLLPLFVFALAPGDRSFLESIKLILLAPVVLLVMWLFGRVSPRWERILLVALPLAVLVFTFGRMLVPEQTLDAIGVPAWLRTDRPQDAELARLEEALEAQRNRKQAERLKAIRAKVDAGQPLTPEDQAAILSARQGRVTLTGWAGSQWQAVVAQVKASLPQGGVPKAPVLVTPAAGSIAAPLRGWSDSVAVPAGWRICTSSPRGERAYVTQCHLGRSPADAWRARSSGECVAGEVDRVRFQAKRREAQVDYRFVRADAACKG